jgi:hypothetical protein
MQQRQKLDSLTGRVPSQKFLRKDATRKQVRTADDVLDIGDNNVQQQFSASFLSNNLKEGQGGAVVDFLMKFLKFEHFVTALDLESASQMAVNLLREILRQRFDQYLVEHPELVKKWKPRFKAIVDAAETLENAAGIGKPGRNKRRHKNLAEKDVLKTEGGEESADQQGRSLTDSDSLDLDDLLLFSYHKMMQSR